MMPHGECALLAVRREVGLEPLVLLRAGAERDMAAVGVQYDDMPGAEIDAVVSLAARAGAVPEIVKTGVRRAGVVFVIAQQRVGLALVAAPGGIVAIGVIGGCAVERVVAQRDHGARIGVQQTGGGLVTVPPAGADVARGQQHFGLGNVRNGRRRAPGETGGAAGVGDDERAGGAAVGPVAGGGRR